jgi:hypothetical protein
VPLCSFNKSIALAPARANGRGQPVQRVVGVGNGFPGNHVRLRADLAAILRGRVVVLNVQRGEINIAYGQPRHLEQAVVLACFAVDFGGVRRAELHHFVGHTVGYTRDQRLVDPRVISLARDRHFVAIVSWIR